MGATRRYSLGRRSKIGDFGLAIEQRADALGPGAIDR